MSNVVFQWPPFFFEAKKLNETKEKLGKKWGSGELPKVTLSNLGWEKLMKKIEELPYDTDSIVNYAQGLKKRYISVLSYQFLNIPVELREKVVIILNHKISWTIVKNAWTQFQSEPTSNHLKKIIFLGFQLNLSPFPTNTFAESIWKKEFEIENGNFTSILDLLKSSEKVFVESTTDLSVQYESNLYYYLLNEIWLAAKPKTFLRELGEFIVGQMKQFPFETLAAIIDRYLTVLEMKEFHQQVGDYILTEFGRPDGKNQYKGQPHAIWNLISMTSQSKFMQWIFSKYIDYALQGDPDRIEYWKRQVYRVDDMMVDENLGILIMYVGDYVFVEFMEKGNALYCYTSEIYHNEIRRRVNLTRKKRKDVFKDQFLAYSKINHYKGRWQWETNHLLDEMTRG